MGVWWAVSSDFMDIISNVSIFAAVGFFSAQMVMVVAVTAAAAVRVLTYAIIYLDFIVTHTYIRYIFKITCVPLLQMRYGWEWDVSGSLELMSAFHSCRFFCSSQLLLFPLLQFRYNRILLKHALKISTHNLRQSTHWNLTVSLCGFKDSDNRQRERVGEGSKKGREKKSSWYRVDNKTIITLFYMSWWDSCHTDTSAILLHTRNILL